MRTHFFQYQTFFNYHHITTTTTTNKNRTIFYTYPTSRVLHRFQHRNQGRVTKHYWRSRNRYAEFVSTRVVKTVPHTLHISNGGYRRTWNQTATGCYHHSVTCAGASRPLCTTECLHLHMTKQTTVDSRSVDRNRCCAATTTTTTTANGYYDIRPVRRNTHQLMILCLNHRVLRKYQYTHTFSRNQTVPEIGSRNTHHFFRRRRRRRRIFTTPTTGAVQKRYLTRSNPQQ